MILQCRLIYDMCVWMIGYNCYLHSFIVYHEKNIQSHMKAVQTQNILTCLRTVLDYIYFPSLNDVQIGGMEEIA